MNNREGEIPHYSEQDVLAMLGQIHPVRYQFKIAQLLCMKHGISLTKNPSYLPERKIVQIKTDAAVQLKALKQAAAEFLEKTGCECTFVN